MCHRFVACRMGGSRVAYTWSAPWQAGRFHLLTDNAIGNAVVHNTRRVREADKDVIAVRGMGTRCYESIVACSHLRGRTTGTWPQRYASPAAVAGAV